MKNNLKIDIPQGENLSISSYDSIIRTPITVDRIESTPLHDAILSSNNPKEQVLKLLHEYEKKSGYLKFINAKDEHGFTCLFTAVTLDNIDLAYDLTKILLKHGCNILNQDNDGYTVLHWSSALGRDKIVKLLLQEKCGNLLVNMQDFNGETALHRSCRLGFKSSVKILLQNGANRHIRNKQYESPLEVLGLFNNVRNPSSRNIVRHLFYEIDPSCKTLILTHEDVLKHKTKEGHQEAPRRISDIYKKIKHHFKDYEVDIKNDFPSATLDLVKCAHSHEYVQLVNRLALVSPENSIIPLTPYIQRTIGKLDKDQLKNPDKCDTFFSKGSLKACLRAVGSIIYAIDQVLDENYRNAFV